MTPEQKIKTKLSATLKKFPGVWWFVPSSGPYGTKGVPDYIICAYGEFIGVECKADKTKKPTPLQTRVMADITRAGGQCFVVYDADTIAEVEVALDACRRRSAEANS